MNLQALVREVMKYRESHTSAKAIYAQELADLQANSDAFREMNSAKVELDAAESLLRDAAVAKYKFDGEKNVAPGIGIRLTKVFSYDTDEALGWAMKHGLALSLDKRVFETIAKNTPIACVEIAEKPTATIATDLSKHYPEQ